MSKNKILQSGYLIIFGVMILLLSFHFVGFGKVKADTDTAQSIAINLESSQLSTSGSQKVLNYNLYGNGSNILSYFRYQDEGVFVNKADDKNSETYFHLYRQTAAISSEGAAKTTLTSTITLSDALKNAGSNGYLTIKPSASYKGNGCTTLFVKFLAGESELYNTGNIKNDSNQNSISASSYKVTTNTYYFIFSGWCTAYNFSKNIEAYFYTPSITLSSSDITKPSFSAIGVSNAESWTASKSISFTVSDSHAGVDRVEVFDSAGAVVSSSVSKSSNTKTANVSFTTTKNNERYTIRAYDNVGNVAETSYTTSYIDGNKPNVQLSAPELTFVYRDNAPYAVFTSALNTPAVNGAIGASSESYFYTTDGSDPSVGDNASRQALTNGEVLIPLSQEQLDSNTKAFEIKVYAVDEAGNAQTLDYTLEVAYFKYSLSTTLRGEKRINYGESIAEITNPGLEISRQIATIVEADGKTFKFQKVMINGELATTELTGDETNGYSFFTTLDADKTIEILYRQVANVVVQKNYNYTGEPITITTLDGTTCPVSAIVFEGTYTDKGHYTVNYAIDETNENFTGSGAVEISIMKEVNAFLNVAEYTYSKDGITLNYSADVDFAYTLEIIKAGESIATYSNENVLAGVINLDVGAYTFKITATEDLTYIKSSNSEIYLRDFEVVKQKVSLQSFEKSLTYNGSIYEFGSTYISEDYVVEVAYFDLEGNVATPLNVGEYSLTIKIVDDSNYEGETTGLLSITPATLRVVANSKSSVYGAELCELDYVATGFVGEENFEFTLVCEEINALDEGERLEFGEYVIKIIERAELTNYEITYTNATYNVTKRDALIEIASGQTKVYGETDPSKFAYTISGLLDGDVLGEVITRVAGENAGNYAISLQGYTNENYDVTCYEKNFRITASKIVVRAPSGTYQYGDTIPTEFEPIIVSGNVIDDLGITLVCEQSGNVGKYEIEMVRTGDAVNYEIVYIPNYIVITKKSIIVEAIAETKTYGENDPSFTFATLNQAGEPLNISLNEFTGALVREAGENVGEYTILVGTLASNNYAFEFRTAKFEITPASLVIKGVSASKTYGKSDPVLTYLTFNLNDEPVSVEAGEITGNLVREAGENVGEYAILNGNVTSVNYTLTFSLDDACFTISPRTAYVVFGEYMQVYGEEQPELCYEVGGVLAGDDLGVSVVRENSECNDAGNYEVSATITNPNYVVEVIKGTLIIDKATSKITAEGAEYLYDGEEKLPSATLSVTGEYSVSIKDELGAPVENVKNAGTYFITYTFDGDKNHYGANVTVKVVIKKADTSVSILRDIFVENGSIQMPEIESELEYMIKFDDASTASNVGTHAYSIVFADENYNEIRGILTILEKPTNSTEGGNVEFVDGDVDSNDVNLVINKTEDNKNAQSAVTDKRVDQTYEIIYNQSSDATIKVELDYVTDDYTNVSVYVYNDKGEAKLLPYKVVDGKIVLSVEADNMKLAIVKQVAGISIVTVGAVVILAGLATLYGLKFHKKRRTKNILKVS
ncbi:MAG: hypothetical protein IJ301_00205 [Clostridia bacterium]|nr:hypothetical protein [Clostridia bacterium]